MKVTMLGCGTSVGVPALGHAGWGDCDPNDPRNRRQRCAVLVEINDKVILVDAGPDIRNQLLPLGLKRIDALLITHTHSDHVAGLDDLRAFYWPDRIDIPVYATKQHSIEILARFPYLFTKHADSPSYFVPPMKMNLIAANDILRLADARSRFSIKITAIPVRLGFCLMANSAIRLMLSGWVMMCLTGWPVLICGLSRRYAPRRIHRTAIMNRHLPGLIG